MQLGDQYSTIGAFIEVHQRKDENFVDKHTAIICVCSLSFKYYHFFCRLYLILNLVFYFYTYVEQGCGEGCGRRFSP